jgi:hypothetical protein
MKILRILSFIRNVLFLKREKTGWKIEVKKDGFSSEITRNRAF